MVDKFEPIIGMEIHVELKTKSKMFCGCRADWFGLPPNSNCCPVCLGLPGALPVPNRQAVEWCVKLGLALNCEIPLFSKFDRKNYFYPDLPKGYQISQYDQPFAVNGQLKFKVQSSKFKDEEKTVRIRRVHMEEDTGKLMHAAVNGEKVSLVDFNRSAVPLVEIVTEPDIRSSEEARVFLKKLHQIIRYVGISDADMEKGSMRLEPNISLRKVPSSKFPVQNNNEILSEEELPKYKVEVKNINSFGFVKKAIDYEIDRHAEIIEAGDLPSQETRGWDEKKGITYPQRSKEEAHDYRYFPEPDIPPVRWTEDKILNIRNKIVELPDAKISRFMKEYGLTEYDATILTESTESADYFEESVKRKALSVKAAEITPKIIANWIINKKADITKVTPEELVRVITQKSQKFSMSDEEIAKIVQKVIDDNPKAMTDYKSGKQQSLTYLLGQVMRQTKGMVNAITVRNQLIDLLSN